MKLCPRDGLVARARGFLDFFAIVACKGGGGMVKVVCARGEVLP